MEFYEVIEKRRSIRRYKDTPIKKETIETILNAARLAPSWKNLQCWKYIVIDDFPMKESILKAFEKSNPGKKSIKAAPVLVVLCAKPAASGLVGDKEYYLVDAGITMEHLVLAACNEGLGTCWLGLFDEEIVRNALKIPDNWRVVAMTPLGYPDQDPRPRPRKELQEIVCYNKWDNGEG